MGEGIERRLTTILAADVAEYSRLMRADEDATLSALARSRTIIDTFISGHRGRIANTAGDSVLAEFPSVAEALSRALAIQPALARENQNVRPERRMLFRVGIHIGDVIIKGGDLGLYFCREYDACVEAARRVIRAYPDHPLVYRWLADTLGQTGRLEEAREALEKAVSMAPASFDFYVRRRAPWHRPDDHAHTLEGLRQAGWQG